MSNNFNFFILKIIIINLKIQYADLNFFFFFSIYKKYVLVISLSFIN